MIAEATEAVVFEFCRLSSKQWLDVVATDVPVSAYLEDVVNEYRYKLSANASKLFKVRYS
jgi:hypothetical protein